MINKYFNIQNIFLLLLIILSLSFNQYYANKGAFPIESFAHFDSAYRILQGDIPFRDYWAVSGIFIDYIQSLFFFLFGNHFQIYVLHASVFNLLITLIVFNFFKQLELNNIFSFFYSTCFLILAYTTSGTLYVDHHASLICFISILFLILAIKNEDRKYFFLIPFLIGIAFLTKPAPTVYFFIFISLILLVYILSNKKYNLIKFLVSSTLIFISLIFAFGYINNIPLDSFVNQYILFPGTIAESRFNNLDISFNNFFLKFKFIYVFLIPIIIIFFNFVFRKKNFLFSKSFFYFLAIFILCISLIFHQNNTKNQLFILFLIPYLAAFLHIQLRLIKIPYYNFFSLLICITCLIFTIKYHSRYNEDRKFHELQNVDFSKTIDASLINKKLSGLKWITPIEPENPKLEINQIINLLNLIKNDETKKMIITNYSFFSVVLNENTNSPSRWFIPNGGAYPVNKKNKYFIAYKNLLIQIINEKKIEKIVIIKPVNKSEITRYLGSKCFIEKKIGKITLEMKIKKNCNF